MTQATDFLQSLTAQDIPAEVLSRACHNLLDLVGVGIGGAATPLSQIIRDHAAEDMPGTTPMEDMNAVIGFSASACSSFHNPRQAGVIRPRGSTAVASAKTRPALPRAKVLR